VRVDNTAPVLSSKPATPVICQCYKDVAAAPLVTANDNFDGTVKVSYIETQSQPGSSCNNVITRTWSATDCAGNSTSFTQTITVNDTTAPAITCPSPAIVEVYADAGQCNATSVPIGEPTATDNSGGAINWTWGRSDGATSLNAQFPIGCTTVTNTATDSCGNSSSCTRTVRVKANLTLTYTGDQFALSSGPTVASASIRLAVHVAPDVTPTCLPITSLTVTFKIYKVAGLTSTLQATQPTLNLDSLGDAAVLVTLPVGTYDIEASIDQCGASGSDSAVLVIDYGSTDQRVTGGGWVVNAQTRNGKANFGYTVATGKGGLRGNSLYMVRGLDGFNYQVKNNSWAGGYLNFYKNATGQYDRARFSGKCNIQKINP